jgi:hypothetical protein
MLWAEFKNYQHQHHPSSQMPTNTDTPPYYPPLKLYIRRCQKERKHDIYPWGNGRYQLDYQQLHMQPGTPSNDETAYNCLGRMTPDAFHISERVKKELQEHHPFCACCQLSTAAVPVIGDGHYCPPIAGAVPNNCGHCTLQRARYQT